MVRGPVTRPGQEHPAHASTFALLPAIRDLVDDMEASRRVPPALYAEMAKAGCLTMGIPAQHGGSEVGPVETSRIVEVLAKADASVAWMAMVALGFNFVYSRFSPDVVAQVRALSPHFLTRGAIAPQGRAVPVDGGYMVEGRWALGSGCETHDFIMASCIVMDGENVATDASGDPVQRIALLPASAVEFLDTWDSVGLRATNSHDFTIKPVFVSEAWTASLTGEDHFHLSHTRFDFQMAVTPNHASVALGIAQGMLDDLVALSLTKRPARGGGKTLASDPLFTHELGHLIVRLRALRAVHEARLDKTAQISVDASTPDPTQSAEVCAIASYVQHECHDIVDQAFGMAGATACYRSSSLQRRWRDIRCVVQHFSASKTKYSDLGRSVLSSAQRQQIPQRRGL